MAKKVQYAVPNDGKHYYENYKFGSINVNANEEDKDETHRSAYDYYLEYSQQLEQAERERQRAAEEAANAPAFTMGDMYNGQTPNVPLRVAANQNNNPAWYNALGEEGQQSVADHMNQQRLKELEDIKSGKRETSDYKVSAARGELEGVSDDVMDMLGNYYSSINNQSNSASSGMSPASVVSEGKLREATGWTNDQIRRKAEAWNTLNTYNENVANNSNFMTENETLEYMKLKIDTLPKGQRESVQKIIDGFKAKTEYQKSWGTNGALSQTYKNLTDEGYKELIDSGMSQEEADKYMEYASRYNDYQNTVGMYKTLGLNAGKGTNYDTNIGKAIGKTVGNTLASGLAFLTSPLGMASYEKDPDNLGARNTYALSNIGNNISNYATEVVTNDVIGANHPVGQFIYGAADSTLKAAEVAAMTAVGIPSSITSVIYSTSAFDSGYKEARERGLTPAQATAEGAISGYAEYITEKVSLDYLIDAAKKAGKEWTFKNWKLALASAGVEGSEEVASDVLSTLGDYFVAGKDGKSQIQRDIADIQAENPFMSYSDAANQAWKNYAWQVGKDFAAGALSGAALGSVSQRIAVNNNADNVQAENEQIANIHGAESDYGKNPYQLRVDMMEDGKSKERMQELADKYARGESLTKSELSEIADRSARSEYKDYAEAVLYGEEKVVDKEQAEKTLAKAASEGDIKTLAKTYKDMKIATEQEVRDAADELIGIYKQEAIKQSGITEAQFNEAIDMNNAISPAKARKIMELAGKTNTDFEQTKKNFGLMLEGFTDNQLRAMYDNGVELGNAEKIKAASEAKLNVVKTLNLSDERKQGSFENKEAAEAAGIDTFALDVFAKGSGINLKFEEESRDKNGYRVNASFNPETNTITFNADTVASVMHEVGEFVQLYNAEGHDSLVKDLMAVAQEIGGKRFLESFSNYKAAYIRAEGKKSDYEVAQEMTNDLFVSVMSTEKGQKAFAEYVNKNYETSVAKGKIQKIVDFFKKLSKSIKGIFNNGRISLSAFQENMIKEKAAELEKYADRLMAEFEKAVENYQKSVLEKVGVDIDTENEVAFPSDKLSLSTWRSSDYVQQRAEAAQALKDALGVSIKQAEDYIDQINDVAAVIIRNSEKLDYMELEGKGMLMDNSEYVKTLDGSTLCKKRLDYTDTLSEIQRRLPNTALTGDQMLAIVNMMQEKGYQTPCGLCYVESTRKQLPKYAKTFLEEYAKNHPDSYVPNMAEINTPEGLNKIRTEHPDIYDAYEKFMNKKGNAKPKLFQTRAAYQAGEVLDFFSRKRGKNTKIDTSKVKKWNINGGLRLQSYSDFEVPQMIDMMQAIIDMSRVGLWSQAYTKVPEFADIFGGTGVKINLSTIAKGVDVNGKLIFDDVEGINSNEAKRLRKKYSDNVGIVTVVFDDAQLKAALNDPEVDYVLPFHRSSWSMAQAADITGQKNIKDYTAWQNEKHPTNKIKNIMPNTYWDFSKDGRANAERYLELCAEDGRTPKFSFLLENKDGKWTIPKGAVGDNYFKLLIDFKMYNNEGVGVPQAPVKPNFDMEVANKVLDEYKGDHNKNHAHMDIVDEFVKNYKEENHDTSDVMESGDDLRYSIAVTDSKKIDELENQEHYTTYRAFQIIDGKLYSPKAARDKYIKNGKVMSKLGYESKLGQWEQATESLDIAKLNYDKGMKGKGLDGREYAKFNLDKVSDVAYNPYLHSSNVVLNDQFTGAYNQNLVVVECVVPSSEDGGTYWAEMAKDPTGWTDWKSGLVAGKIAEQKPEFQRQVFLSRWMKPVRVLSDQEVAQMYKGYLDGTTGIEVPWNVVTPSLRSALIDVGVPIKYGKAAGTNAQFEKEFPNERYSLNVEDFYNLQFNDGVNPSQTMVFKDEVREAMSDIFNQVESRKKNKKNLNFKGIAYSYNHIFLFENKGRRVNDYDIIRIMDADSLEANIHEVNTHEKEQVQRIVDEIDEVFRNGQQIYRRGSDILAQGRGTGSNANLSSSESAGDKRGYNGYNGDDSQKFSLNVEDISFDEWMLDVDDILKDLANKISDSKKRKEYVRHLTRAALGDEFKVVDGKKIAFTDERVEKLLRSYASTNKDYAQAYVTYMSPADFLLLTTNGTKGTETLDKIKSESTPLDMDELIKQMDYQPMFIDVRERGKKLQVTGHEGRHRMYALQVAGYTQIPVLVFNYDNKYSKVPIDSISAIPQDFTYGEAKYNKSNHITLNNLQPLSRGNVEAIKSNYGSGTNADIRYSLNVDDKGRHITEAQEKKFKDSKVVDKDGNILTVYHGSVREFYEFDRSYAKVDGNMGKGFYFTNNEEDVDRNYANRDGADFTGRVEREAELIEEMIYDNPEEYSEYEGMDHDQIVEALKDKYATAEEPVTMECYLDIKNPVYVGNYNGNRNTILLDEFTDGIVEEDFEDEDDYYQALDEAVADKIEEIVDYVTDHLELFDYEKDVASIREVLYEAASEGGATLEQLKASFEDKFIYDEEYDMADSEVARLVAEALGYDGIIDNTVSQKFRNMGLNKDTVHFIIFNSNQAKFVTNENPTDAADVRHSLDIDDSDYMTVDGEWDDEFGFLGSSSSILEEGMRHLKGNKIDKKKIDGIATKLRNEFGSKYDVKTLSDNLEKVFAYLQTEDHINYEDVMSILRDVAIPVINEATKMDGVEEYKAFVDSLKGYRIKLTEVQKQEVRSMFGSYGDFTRNMMPIRFSDHGTITLEALWGEISDKNSWLLPMDTNEGDMPLVMYDALSSLRPTPVNKYGGSVNEVAQDFAMRVVEEYLGGQAAQKMQKLNKQYKEKVKADYNKRLEEARKKFREEGASSMAKYKEMLQHKVDEAQYRERWAAAEGKQEIANEKQRLQEDYEHKVKEAQYNARWKEAENNKSFEERKAELYARNKQKAVNARERQAQREERKKIQQASSKLISWIEHPSEENHVPKGLKVPILDFIRGLDFVEPVIKRAKDGSFYANVYNNNSVDGEPNFEKVTGSSMDEVRHKVMQLLENGMGSKSQLTWLNKMNGIRSLLNKAANMDSDNNSDVNNIIQMLDPELIKEFDDMVDRNANVLDINNISSSDLKTINKVIKGIMHVVRVGNKAYTSKATIEEWATATIDNSKNIKLKDHTKLFRNLSRVFSLDMATPDTFFAMMGSAGESIEKSLNEAFARKVTVIKTSQEYIAEAMKNFAKQEINDITGNTAKTYRFFNGAIELTKAQIMSLYELNKRNQAVLHFAGGIKADTIKVKENGKLIRKEHTQNVPVHFSRSQIVEITNTLSDKEKALADAMQFFMADRCAKWGNEASDMMYGYNKYLDPNYFPITSDKTTVRAENTEKIEALNGIERMGMTKDVNINADNPLIIRDIFDVFVEHTTNMAAYYGYAASIKDINRWYNFKFREDMGDGFNRQITVKSAINTNVFRTDVDNEGCKYLEKLIRDINGSERTNEVLTPLDNFVNLYKGQSIAGNIRVVIQQPTAIVRAANVIDPKYLIKGAEALKHNKVNMDRIKEASPLAWWKSQGYYEASMGKPIREIITGQASFRDKVIESSMALAGKADDITWSVLYTAVEKEQADIFKGKDVSEEAFRKAVNERFDKIIAETQVVDTVLQKSQWMRGKTFYNKMQTSFMAEPTKSYNMLMKNYLLDYKDSLNGVKTFKRTAKAVAVLAVTDLVNAMAQSLVDAMRHKDDDDGYWETWLKYVGDNLVDNVNIFKKVPVLKDLFDKVLKTIKGERVYANDMQTQALDSILNMYKEFNKWKSGDSKYTLWGRLLIYSKGLSVLTGIPLYNVQRDLGAAYNMLPYKDLTQKQLTDSDYMNDIKEALDTDDAELVDDQVRDAVEDGGIPIKNIQSKLNSTYKSQYYDLYNEEGEEAAAELANMIKPAYLATGMSEEEFEDLINGWLEESYSYSSLDKAIRSGEGIEEAVEYIKGGKDDDKIVEHIMKQFGSSIDYEEANSTNTTYKENVEKALSLVGEEYTYDKVAADMKAKEEKAAAKTSAYDKLYNSVDSMNGSAGREAIQTLIDMGVEPKTIKSNVSNKYHEEWREATIKSEKDSIKNKWLNTYKLINNVGKVKNARKPEDLWKEWEKTQESKK